MTVTPLHVRHHAKAPYRAAVAGGEGTITSFLAGYELHLVARGQAAKTVEKKLLAARQLAAFLGDPDVTAVTRGGVESFIAARLATSARATVATTVVALRGFFAYLDVDLRGFPSPMAGITAPAYEAPAVGRIDRPLLEAMIASCEKKREKDWEDVRDAAVLRVFIDTGARLAEVTNLTLPDVLPLDDGRILLRVYGKGRGGGPRERHLPIGTKAAVALRRYLRLRSAHPHSSSPSLWLGRKGPLTAHGMREMVYRRSERAGRRLHPHEFRHNWAVTMKADERKRAGDIMHLAGWADRAMLDRYGRAVTGERAVAGFYDHGAPGDDL